MGIRFSVGYQQATGKQGEWAACEVDSVRDNAMKSLNKFPKPESKQNLEVAAEAALDF
jgi:hypothetical protein